MLSAFHFVILNPLNSPEWSVHSTSTFLTTAPRGPTWQNRISSSNRALSPSARASTLPSGRFLTHPEIPSLLARSVISLLKKTPWTKPVIRTLARAPIHSRNYVDAFLSCFRLEQKRRLYGMELSGCRRREYLTYRWGKRRKRQFLRGNI